MHILQEMVDTTFREYQDSSFPSSDQNHISQNSEENGVKIGIIDSDHEAISRPLFYYSSVQSFCFYGCLSFLILVVYILWHHNWYAVFHTRTAKRAIQPEIMRTSFLHIFKDGNPNSSSWSQAINQYDEFFLVASAS